VSEPITVRARVGAPITAVRGALRDAGAVRGWLAEHADVDLPHRFSFWGRDIPGGEEPRQRVLHTDEDTIRLSWHVLGADTTTELLLAQESNDSILTITQSCEPDQVGIAGYPAGLSLMMFWSLAIENLVDYLKGREITPRCDFTSDVLRAEFRIGAPRDAVFDSVVDPSTFRQWFGLDIALEPEAGGTWSLQPGGPVGRVLEFQPGRLLVLEEETGVSRWEFADDGAATRFTFGFNREGDPPYPGWMGWLCGISQLRRYHELGERQPIWLAA
jgi:hypothetical protein